MRRAAPRGIQTVTTIRPSRRPDRDEARLAIVPAIVGMVSVAPSKNLHRPRHVEPAMVEGRLAFGRVKLNLHILLWRQKITTGKLFLDLKGGNKKAQFQRSLREPHSRSESCRRTGVGSQVVRVSKRLRHFWAAQILVDISPFAFPSRRTARAAFYGRLAVGRKGAVAGPTLPLRRTLTLAPSGGVVRSFAASFRCLCPAGSALKGRGFLF